MKDFIKHKLRTLLESKTTRHTPFNSVNAPSNKYSTQADLERTLNKVVTINNQYGNDPYYLNANEGDGTYRATILPNGHVKISTPNNAANIPSDDIGMLKTSNTGGKSAYIKAYRGMDHPSNAKINPERKGHAKGKSPAEDAFIKAHILFGKEIIDTVKQNMEGEDSYTIDRDEIDHTSKTGDKNQYKYDKLDKEKERASNKSTLSLDNDEAALRQKLRDLTQAKVDATKNRDRELLRDIKKQIKDIQNQLK